MSKQKIKCCAWEKEQNEKVIKDTETPLEDEWDAEVKEIVNRWLIALYRRLFEV